MSGDSDNSQKTLMHYGVEMGLVRITGPKSRLPLLVATTLVAFFAVIACGDGDEGFRDDPQAGNDRSGGPGPGPAADPSDDFTDDPRIADRANGSELESATATDEVTKLPGRMHGDRTHGIWPQVWSQHAPDVKSWEYKVNCDEAISHTDPCFLSDLTSVRVTTPSGELIELEKDFNTNEFSGEITRRWVLYGPSDGHLPEQGDYVYSYSRGDELLYEQVIPFDSGVISYPTEVEWRRDGRDIVVTWNPPPEAASDMHYKALIWQVEDTPETFISDLFDWNADTAVLPDVPMIVGGKYSLNVAIYFDDGYAYSEYVIFEWPEP
jgi:hypothetical protein